MSKNKLRWSVALFLIAVLTLPVAYAQSFTGSRIFFILINAAVIGIVLFILQAVLIPGKPDKERVSAWIIVIIASLLIAWFFGSTGYIWQGPLAIFLNVHVLVNAVIIAAVLYFVLGLLKVNEKLGNSKEGNIGYGLLLFIISLLFSLKLGNQWLWSQPTISTLISYFFGQYGILTTNQNRIFIFIGTAALFAVFFDYLGLGKENRKLNYILAIIFAANLVSGPNPYSYADIKPLILIIGTWILGGNLSEKFTGKWKIAGYAISFLLMMWAVSSVETAVTPEGRAAVAANGGGATGWIWGWITTLLSSKGLWILGAIILFLFFAIFRGETRRRALTVAWSDLKRRLNAITKSTEFTEDIEKGREPSFFVRYRMLFHALASYTTRSEITYRYWDVVKDGGKMYAKLYPRLKKYLNQEKLRKDIIVFRSGGTLSNGEKIKGWNRLNLEVVELINKYYALLARIQVSSDHELKPADEYTRETAELAQISNNAVTLSEEIKNIHSLYQERLDAYGAHYYIKGYRDIILNMSNVTGDVLEHPLKFARPGAKFIMGNQAGKPDTAGFDPKGYPTDEVTQLGEVVADINEQKDSFGNLPPDPRDYRKPRKVHPKDIVDHPMFNELVDNVEFDWKNLAYDIRYGQYHPFSRTHSVYIKAFGDRIYPEFQDKDIPFRTSPSTSDWAVDMRTLANPGLNKFWGRKSFNDTKPPLANPLPVLSSLGLKKFLFEAAKLAHTDQEEVTKYLNKYYVDSGVPEKDLNQGFYMGVMMGKDVDLSKRE